MFGFIRKKIKGFVDQFSKETDDAPIDEAVEPVEPADDTGPEAAEPVETETDFGTPGAVGTSELVAPPDEEADAALDATLSGTPERSVASELAEEAAIDENEATRILEDSADEIAVSGAEADEALSHAAPVGTQSEDEALEAASSDIETGFDAERRTEPDGTRSDASAIRIVGSEPETGSEPSLATEPSSRTEPEERTKRRGFGQRIAGAFSRRTLSEEQFDRLFEDLEIGLLEANTAYDAVQAVKENLRERLTGERVSRFSAHDDVERALKESISALFEEPEDLVALARSEKPLVIMLIGINGSGKTTTAAKLAHAYQKAGLTPVLAAADTFRAAAIQQLEEHAKALEVRIVKHDYGVDPAAVAYDAVAHAKSGKADVVIIDTAGRLHSNENLLKELEKVKRVARPDRIVFVGESIAGNDLLEQAETFNERVGIDGIILTKTDVDDRGGGALSVSHVTKKPIDYLCAGQGYDDITPFTVGEIARLLGLE